MFYFQNLNEALIRLSKEILRNGDRREVRGFKCIELSEPVLICISNPCDRYVTIPERKWNKILPFAEFIWLMLGLNDLNSLPGKYVKNLYNFSDNGATWRAGYGPRLRAMTGYSGDYFVSEPNEKFVYSGSASVVDQVNYVIKAFKRDINTRQAIIEIGDPVKDSFEYPGSNDELKKTKDYPCTRSLMFAVRKGALDLTVTIRSNDLIWGFSAVNVFNFTMIQEVVAGILGIPVGKYYHMANNLHIYEDKFDLVKKISMLNAYEYINEDKFYYEFSLRSLEEFDDNLLSLFNYIKGIEGGQKVRRSYSGNEFFEDMCRIFENYHFKEDITFINPFLNRLYYGNTNLSRVP